MVDSGFLKKLKGKLEEKGYQANKGYKLLPNQKLGQIAGNHILRSPKNEPLLVFRILDSIDGANQNQVAGYNSIEQQLKKALSVEIPVYWVDSNSLSFYEIGKDEEGKVVFAEGDLLEKNELESLITFTNYNEVVNSFKKDKKKIEKFSIVISVLLGILLILSLLKMVTISQTDLILIGIILLVGIFPFAQTIAYKDFVIQLNRENDSSKSSY